MVTADAPPHQTLPTLSEGTIILGHDLDMEEQATFIEIINEFIATLDAEMPGLLQPGPLSSIYFEDDPVIVSPDVGAGDDDDDDEDMEADECVVADEAEQQQEESDSDTDTVINAYLDPSPMWCGRAPIVD